MDEANFGFASPWEGPTMSRLRSFRAAAFPALFAACGLSLLCGCGSGIANLAASAGTSNTPAPVAVTSGPQLGYFWNAADQTLRPVLGIPGSSQVGASVVPAGTYVAGAASAASGMGVLQEQDGSLDVMSLPSGQPVHLAASVAVGASIRFSPNGRAALVFAPGGSSVQVVTGLNKVPAAAGIALSGAVMDATVSDAGRVVVAISGAAGTVLQAVNASGAASTVGSAGVLGGLSFVGSDDVVYADASANTLTVVHNASTAPSPAQVPTTALLQAPKALGVSANGQWVLVANGAEPTLVRLDLTAQAAPLKLTCNCTPTLVATLAGQGAFRVTNPASGEPLWAVDAGVATPRAFFIPAMPVVKP